MDVWLTQPEITLNSKIQADCPHCGDGSVVSEVKGVFHLGATDYTQIIDIKYLDAEYILTKVVKQNVSVKTTKGKQYG